MMYPNEMSTIPDRNVTIAVVMLGSDGRLKKRIPTIPMIQALSAMLECLYIGFED